MKLAIMFVEFNGKGAGPHFFSYDLLLRISVGTTFSSICHSDEIAAFRQEVKQSPLLAPHRMNCPSFAAITILNQFDIVYLLKGLSERGLSVLSQLQQLNEFSLKGAYINGTGFSSLFPLKSLKVSDIAFGLKYVLQY